jgi:hypothetical protein
MQRSGSLFDLNARPDLKRAVPVADENGISVAVTQRHDQIYDAIAIQVTDTNVVAGRKKVATRN